MGQGNARQCPNGHKGHPPRLMVTQRLCNHSAFNGYQRTPSDYSTVRCCVCGNSWRTRANYVADLPDAPSHWTVITEPGLVKWHKRLEQVARRVAKRLGYEKEIEAIRATPVKRSL